MNGILLLDKPRGLSSNAALQRVRRLLGADKAGHVGSLDPLATGMLPICLGEATKVAGDITAARKRYQFTLALGARTATGDLEGEVVEEAPVPSLTTAQVQLALEVFRGAGSQVPPMFSALKRDGQPLYKLARAGLTVERAPRRIEISELSLVRLAPTELELVALCSKGTYIRVLAEDIARRLGTCGHVSALRRLYVEPFEHSAMLTLAEVEAACSSGVVPALIAPDEALPGMPCVHLPAELAQRLAHGQAVAAGGTVPGKVRLYDPLGRFMGLGEADDRGQVRPRRLIAGPKSAFP
ncbi:MAG TPA: tRNA pseudouridine(55) synthase TruB [Steroidobacteraceae bacterium]|nr:tRNA pseudouridine(55) synthase TruB [Steroidobacteraceae bacterium]